MTEEYYPSWNELEGDVIEIADHISGHGFEPDAIIGIARGGLPFATYLSHYFDCPLRYINSTLYQDRKKGKGPRIDGIYLGNISSGDRVILFDDIVDTGETMEDVIRTIQTVKPIDFTIITAAIHVKSDSEYTPEYYARETDEWVVYPWERNDGR